MQLTKRNPPANLHQFPIVTLVHKNDGELIPVDYYIVKLDWLGDLVAIDEYFATVTTIAINDKWQECHEYADSQTAAILRRIVSNN